MNTICLAIGDEVVENWLKVKLKDKYEFTKDCLHVDMILTVVEDSHPDVLIFSTMLQGSDNGKNSDKLLGLIEEIRVKYSFCRVILLASNVSDRPGEFLETVVNLGVYDILPGNPIKIEKVLRMLQTPSDFSYANRYKIDKKHEAPPLTGGTDMVVVETSNAPDKAEKKKRRLFGKDKSEKAVENQEDVQNPGSAPALPPPEKQEPQEAAQEQQNPPSAPQTPPVSAASTVLEPPVQPKPQTPPEPPVPPKPQVQKKQQKQPLKSGGKQEKKQEAVRNMPKNDPPQTSVLTSPEFVFRTLSDEEFTAITGYGQNRISSPEGYEGAYKKENILYAGMAPAKKRGKVYTVCGGRGGVGCTSIAINTATMLVRKGKVLLIDIADGGGVYDAYGLTDSGRRGITSKAEASLIIPGGANRPLPDFITSDRIADAGKYVDAISYEYDYVVVDAGRFGLTDRDTALFRQTDVLLCVDIPDFREIEKSVTIISQLPQPREKHLVINRYNQKLSGKLAALTGKYKAVFSQIHYQKEDPEYYLAAENRSAYLLCEKKSKKFYEGLVKG